MRKIDKIFKNISDAINSLSAVIVLIAIFLFSINSCLRYFIKYSIKWADELSTYSIVIAVFLMLIVLDYNDSAISIDYIYDKMKKGSIGKKILDVVRWCASMFTACILTYSGYRVVRQAIIYNHINVATKIPYSAIYGLVFFGVVIMLAYKLFMPFISAMKKEGESL